VEKGIGLAVNDAVLLALEKNPSFRIDRISPLLRKESENEARSAFDPTVSGDLSVSLDKSKDDYHDQTETTNGSTGKKNGSLSVKQFLPTGTTVELGVSSASNKTEAAAQDTEQISRGYDLTVTQSLLRGFGTGVNLVSLRKARLETEISNYELRGAAEALVADVENVYWDCILSERSIEIYEKSLDIAEKQIEEVKERIKIGNMAETELVSSEAELASRKEDLIDAKSNLESNRLKLLRLLNPDNNSKWNFDMQLTANPDSRHDEPLGDVNEHVMLGLQKRSDLNQAILTLKQGKLDIVRTRNGLLPKLDLFISLGGTSYSKAFTANSDRETDDRDLSAGVSFEYALGNRSEKAAYRSAKLSLKQSKISLLNMEQLVQVDIRTAYIEVERSRAQIKATAATRKLREEALRTEQEKFRVGQSTSILVSQAWRDLVESQISEVSAIIQLRKALLDLYLKEGSLLERRGISSSEKIMR
jgi:outer membrane protein TolC